MELYEEVEKVNLSIVGSTEAKKARQKERKNN